MDRHRGDAHDAERVFARKALPAVGRVIRAVIGDRWRYPRAAMERVNNGGRAQEHDARTAAAWASDGHAPLVATVAR